MVPGRDRLSTPGSAVRHASVARHWHLTHRTLCIYQIECIIVSILTEDDHTLCGINLNALTSFLAEADHTLCVCGGGGGGFE